MMRFWTVIVMMGLVGQGQAVRAQDETAGAVVRPAKVMTVATSANTVSRNYPGIVLPSQEAELSFKVSGEVIELPIRGGDEVKAGDVIARIDPRDYEAVLAQLESQRDQALANLSALRTGARTEEVAALEAAVASSQAQLDQAADQAARSRELAERGVVSQARLDQDEAAELVAQAGLQAAQEELAIGLAGGRAEDIAASEAAIRGLESQIQTARDNVEDTTLRAPFDGVVANRRIENFTNVQAGQNIILLQQLRKVELVFDVPGPDVLIWAAHDDTQASVEIEALNYEPVHADLAEFSTQADPTTQTYRVRVALDVPEGKQIFPGMAGRVTVSSEDAAHPAMMVPLTAVAGSGEEARVWLLDPTDNTVAPHAVQLGDVFGSQIEIIGGLEEGAQIVTAGLAHLQDGMQVRPIARVGN